MHCQVRAGAASIDKRVAGGEGQSLGPLAGTVMGIKVRLTSDVCSPLTCHSC